MIFVLLRPNTWHLHYPQSNLASQLQKKKKMTLQNNFACSLITDYIDMIQNVAVTCDKNTRSRKVLDLP